MTLLVDHPWVFVLGTIAGLALAWFTYRSTTPPQPPGRRALLIALRALALAILFFLLADPLLRRVFTTEQPPVLAVLVDDSQSIAFHDSLSGGGLSGDLQTFLDALPSDLDTRLFAFSNSTRRLPDLDSLTRNGPRTDIARALGDLTERLRGDNLQGIVLVSDGNVNTGRNPVYVAEKLGVRLFPVVVGDTSALRDVRLRRVVTNRVVYTGSVVPVQVAVQGIGYGGERVVVTLRDGARVLDSQATVLPDGGGDATLDLSFTPQNDGVLRLTADVSRLDGEATFRNNVQTATVQVRSNRRRVLLVGAAPEPDVSALRQAMESDASLDVTARVQKGPGEFYEGPLPNPSGFDAVVLAGYPGAVADAASIGQIRAAAEKGVGIAFFATARTDYNRLRGLADVLPAAPNGFPPRFTETFPMPTPAGTTHPLLAIDGAPPLERKRLPPLQRPDLRWTLAPDARVLATSEVRGVRFDDPLLVVRRTPDTRALMLLGTGVWRWNTLPRDLEDAALFWPAFVSNAVRWVATRDDARRVRVETVESVFGGEERVQFTGQVYDESLQPVERARVQVNVTAADGAVRPFVMQHVGNGRYTLDAGTLPPGDYRFGAAATLDAQPLGDDAGVFSVGALALEYQEPRADYGLMQGLAQRTSGRAFSVARLDSLPGLLARLPTFTPTIVAREAEQPLHDAWPFLALVVLLLTAEWVLRKRSGLV